MRSVGHVIFAGIDIICLLIVLRDRPEPQVFRWKGTERFARNQCCLMHSEKEQSGENEKR